MDLSGNIIEVDNRLDVLYEDENYEKMTDYINYIISISFDEGFQLRILNINVSKFIDADMFLSWVMTRYIKYKYVEWFRTSLSDD